MTQTRKYIFIGVLALILILGLGWQFREKLGLKSGSLQGVDRNLTKEQEQKAEDKIQKSEEFLKTLNASDKAARAEYVNAQVLLGQQYYLLGDLEKARKYYNEALAVEPGSEAALIALSITYSEAGDNAKAREALEKAISANGKSADLWIRYIEFRIMTGASTQETDDLYNQALAGTSRNIDVLTKDAQFQEKAGNFAQAISLWEEASRSYPQNAELYQKESDRLKQNIQK